MTHSLPYIPLSNRCPAPGAEEAVIPVTFEGKQVTDAVFDGVCYNFDLNGRINDAIISGEFAYVARYVDEHSDVSPAGKRRRYTEIELIRPMQIKPR